MAITGSRFFWHAVFIFFLVVYVALLIPQLDHGLASLDAHAIVKVTKKLVEQGQLEPGSTNANYCLGN